MLRYLTVGASTLGIALLVVTNPVWASSATSREAAQESQQSSDAQEQALANARAVAGKIAKACGYSSSETDLKKLEKELDCVQKKLLTVKRKIMVEKSLITITDQAFGVTPAQGAPAPPPAQASPAPGPQPAFAGQSASNTPSTCGTGNGTNNPNIRVHRMLMAPKNASDDFGYRLARRYIIYQVTIANGNKDFQFLIHDVTVDLGGVLGFAPGSYLYSASSQELSLLRGVPEKGQDLDPRNLTLHVLQGIGSVAAAVSGLTSFSDTMGPSVAVFNGPFLQGLIGIAPDHTATQLNRLSDSAYIVNTLIEKQRAKTIAIFVPEATILNKAQQKAYWKDPNSFLQTLNLDQADVCVDGAFITTLPAPTLTSAVLTAKTGGQKLGSGVDASLTVTGTNLAAGDTQVVGLGSAVTLTNTNGTTATIDDIKLPSNYSQGITIHLASAANPTLTSATIATAEASPTVSKAVLVPDTAGTPLAPGVKATLKLEGTNLTLGDTQAILGDGAPVTLTTATGTAGSVDLTLPPNYMAGMPVQVTSLANPKIKSEQVATTTTP